MYRGRLASVMTRNKEANEEQRARVAIKEVMITGILKMTR